MANTAQVVNQTSLNRDFRPYWHEWTAVMMMDMTPPPFDSLNEMTSAECLRRLATVEHGRLGISYKALPIVVPVKVAFSENYLLIRSLLRDAIPLSTGSVVALEVGTMGSNSPEEWSVAIRGLLQSPLTSHLSEAGLFHLSTEVITGWVTSPDPLTL